MTVRSGEERRPYQQILRLDELLALFGLDDEDSDDHFFLGVHQIFEMWFDQMIRDLERVRAALLSSDLAVAGYHLRRVVAIDGLLIEQMSLLWTLSRDAFERIRDRLGAASGLQSVQFRELELLCGLRRPEVLDTPGFSVEDRDRLRARSAESSIREAFETCSRACSTREGDMGPALHDIAVRLAEHDDLLRRWRHGHADVAAHFLGTRQGTAGSSGASYLEATTASVLFPELVGLAPSRSTRIPGRGSG